MDPVIDAKQLRKSYGKVLAVNDLSFSVQRGECFGILGPNGAGKTTTIRMLYGFSPMTSGKLRVFGLDVETAARTIKARIGVCQQENNLDPDLTVLQNLAIFASYYSIPTKIAHQRALELLSFMVLDHRQNARANELSGGMMRRLVLARALINEPELVILDEPTTGLDPQTRHQVWERLESLKAGGMTILLTTHYMDEAFRLCDRLLIMDNGRFLIQGNPEFLVREHVGRDIIEVAEPTNALRSFVDSRGLQYEDLGHRLIIYAEDHHDLFHEISSRYSREGYVLRMATLEDVFLKLTGRDLRE
jgi:lipooligosaccharide transport system ATP-binding protein